MLPGLAVSMVAATLALQPVQGADQLFEPSKPHIVWVGEIHGTKEQPALFGDLVEYASRKGRPVKVILERSESEQPELDAFLASDGGSAAIAALLKAPSWNWPIQDGRSSRAMLRLAERLRLLYQSRRILGVSLMVPEEKIDAPDEYETRMSDVVKRAAASTPQGIVLVFSGNAHASQRRRNENDASYTFSAGHLPLNSVTSVFIEGGAGSAWNCQTDCGPNATSGYPAHGREVKFSQEKPGFNAIAWTGLPSSVSSPAAVPAVRSALPH